ncbi:MAG TPA: hypothetical protein PKD12_21615, partial [Nitrospira sp.]|nr:hypothetical protein [Nitrospira sp.]
MTSKRGTWALLVRGVIVFCTLTPGLLWAKVQVLPETVLLVEGKKISGQNSLLHHPVVEGVVAAFQRAESGLQQEEIDRLMQFYAPSYDYHGLKQADV